MPEHYHDSLVADFERDFDQAALTLAHHLLGAGDELQRTEAGPEKKLKR
jgi:hypothetical protein